MTAPPRRRRDVLAAHARDGAARCAPAGSLLGICRPAAAGRRSPACLLRADRALLRGAGAAGAPRLARLPAAHRAAARLPGRLRALPALRALHARSAVLRAGQAPRVRRHAHRQRAPGGAGSERRGALLLGAHLGSFEAMRGDGADKRVPLNIVGYFKNARLINGVLEKLNPGLAARVISVERNIDFVLELKERIDAGEMVALLGDRVGLGDRVVEVDLFGAPALLPAGPYLLAATPALPGVPDLRPLPRAQPLRPLLRAVRRAHRAAARRRAKRGAAVWAQRFAQRLEHYCRLAPDNWFNFYAVWKVAGVSRRGEIADGRVRRRAADAGADLRRRAGRARAAPERRSRSTGRASRRAAPAWSGSSRAGRVIYGVTTGVGESCETEVPPELTDAAVDQPAPLPRLRHGRAAGRRGGGGGGRGAPRVAGARPLGRAPAGARAAGRPARNDRSCRASRPRARWAPAAISRRCRTSRRCWPASARCRSRARSCRRRRRSSAAGSSRWRCARRRPGADERHQHDDRARLPGVRARARSWPAWRRR